MTNTFPTGIVTFLMTDVVGSAALWRSSPHASALMARQAELIGQAIARHGGVRPADQEEGDSTLSAFATPRQAIAAARDAQRALIAERWPGDAVLRVRMALHTGGDAEIVDEHNYGGLTLIRCARLRAIAGGGQVVVSSATAALAGDQLPDGATLVELGAVSIADFARPERVSALCHPDLPETSTPLRGSIARLPVWPTPLIGRERERAELAHILREQRIVTVTGAGGSGKTRLDWFERHNADVERTIPKSRLLIFDVGQGWVPLCNFLDVAVPSEPFPRLNDRESFAQFGPR